MEVNGGGRRMLMSRETSPDRARGVVGFSSANIAAAERQAGMMRVIRGSGSGSGSGSGGPSLEMARRRVQIVYYLSRNGQLEHPHFMELSHLPIHHHLRLRDVMERLTVLRGRGMPSLYSWSCKRSYKNGYVWNDLSENDVIYPADGAEYVLKGSEIIPGSSCPDRFQQQLRPRPPKPLPTRLQIEPEPEYDDESDEDEDETAGGDLTASGGTQCSRGVSTDEAHVAKKQPAGAPKPRGGAHQQTEIAVDDGSPPSSSSSDPAAEPAGLGRNSVFLSLIACGSGAGVKGRKSAGSLHKSAVLGRAARASRVEDGEEEVRFMSENPRFGNLQGEDKEYFSGSVVLEATRSAAAELQQPGLKKSSSYNEERSSKVGIGEESLVVGGERSGGGVKGKCIPGRKKPSSSKK